MNYRVIHETRYTYSETVTLCHNEAHLIPRTFDRQRCSQYGMHIEPRPVDYQEREDFFGNRIAYFSIEQPHRTLTVTATSEVETQEASIEAMAVHKGIAWEKVRDQLMADNEAEVLDARQYTLDSPLIKVSPELLAFAHGAFSPGRSLVEAVLDLIGRIHREFTYAPGFSTVTTPLSQVLEQRRGVCQDFAQLAIGCLRALGLAARYVSGYLETIPPLGQERLAGADASHAWFAVYVPIHGWLDFDPTNNQATEGQHITAAWGRDYSDVSPLKGVVFGGGTQHTLSVSVDVARIGT